MEQMRILLNEIDERMTSLQYNMELSPEVKDALITENLRIYGRVQQLLLDQLTPAMSEYVVGKIIPVGDKLHLLELNQIDQNIPREFPLSSKMYTVKGQGQWSLSTSVWGKIPNGDFNLPFEGEVSSGIVISIKPYEKITLCT